MKKVLTISYLLLLIVLSSCSKVSKTYSEETVAEDLQELKKELSASDFEILGSTILRSAFQQKSLDGKSYADILKEGKEWKEQQEIKEKEQKALVEKAEKAEQERIDKLNQTVVVACVSKGYDSYDYQHYITYKFAIDNKSDKNIRGVKGTIVFLDLFGDKITSLGFKYDQSIKAGETATYDASTDYNKYIDKDVKLRNTELKDMTVSWIPEKIIFEDGTSLE